MTHPLEHWPPNERRRALVAVIAAAVILQVVLTLLDGPLRASDHGGTIPLEVAGSPGRADEIVSSWEADGVIGNGAFITGLDFLYAPLYAAAYAGACVALAAAWRRRGRERLAILGIAAAWAATAAAGFDYVENVGLTVTLLDEPASPWPQISLIAAIAKFAGIAAAALYLLTGLGIRWASSDAIPSGRSG
jgi:hypothetical protein